MNLAALSGAYPGFQGAQANIAALAAAKQQLDAGEFELAQKRRALDAAVMAIAPRTNVGPTAPAANLGAFNPIPQMQPVPQPVAAPTPAPSLSGGAYQPPKPGEVGAAPQPVPMPEAPAAPAAAPPAADGGLDTPPQADLFKQSNDALNSIVDEVRAANPNADPATLAMAVHQRLELLDKVNPEAKAMAAQQVQMFAAQARYYDAMKRAQTAADAQAALKAYRDGLLEIGRGNMAANQTRAGAAASKASGNSPADLQKSIDKLMAQKTQAFDAYQNARSRMLNPNVDGPKLRAELNQRYQEIDAQIEDLKARASGGGKPSAAPGAATANKPVVKARADGTEWEQQPDGKWKRIK